MKIYICEEWGVPRYDVFASEELLGILKDKCKEVDVLEIDYKQILHDRNRWRESSDLLAELFRPGLMEK